MKILSVTIILVSIITFVFQIDLAMGDRDFRLLDPISGGRYGKSAYAGPPYLYFASTSYYYHLDDAEYDDWEDAVSDAFSSWADNSQVGFSSSVSSGLPLETFYTSSGYPEIVNPGLAYTSSSSYVINPSSSYIQLNTFHEWNDEEQNLDEDLLDVESIMVHEIGHIYGIAHPIVFTSGANAPTMAGGDNEYFWDSLEGRSLEDDDIDAARFLQLRVPSLYSTIAAAVSAANDIEIGFINVASGRHSVTSNITVDSDVSLEIEAGATINLGATNRITVDGILVADGTSGNEITFDKSGANRWGGIRFEDSSDDSECSLSYCTIKNASYAVYCNSSDPYIANNTIQYTSVGITLQYPDATSAKVNNNVMNNLGFFGIYQVHGDSEIHSNEIQDAGNGIYIQDGDSKIQGNSIYDSNTEGVKLDGADPTMTNNMIYDNAYNGVYCYDYSDPTFRLAFQGNNVIAYNLRNGVSIASTSTADLTTYSSPTTSANSLYNNGASYYEVYSLQSSETEAQYNWWGESPPDGDRLYGDVDSSNWRTSDPNDDPPGHKLLVIPADPSHNADSDVEDLASNHNALKILEEGYSLQAEEKYEEALVKYQTIISEYPESFEAMLALSRVRKCFKMTDNLDALGSYLSSIYKPNESRILGGKVLEMQIPIHVRNKAYDEAIANCATIIQNFPENEIAKSALHQTFAINNDFKKDLGAAKTAMDQYGTIYPNDEQHLLMKLSLGEITSEQADALRNSLLKSKEPVNEKEIIPVEFIVSQNYPNPFNPETKIQIGLPKDSDVKLQIFNIRGQVVATPFEGDLPAGSHTVNFNASALPSGVYFYKIVAGEFSDVKRMVLVK